MSAIFYRFRPFDGEITLNFTLSGVEIVMAFSGEKTYQIFIILTVHQFKTIQRKKRLDLQWKRMKMEKITLLQSQ